MVLSLQHLQYFYLLGLGVACLAWARLAKVPPDVYMECINNIKKTLPLASVPSHVKDKLDRFFQESKTPPKIIDNVGMVENLIYYRNQILKQINNNLTKKQVNVFHLGFYSKSLRIICELAEKRSISDAAGLFYWVLMSLIETSQDLDIRIASKIRAEIIELAYKAFEMFKKHGINKVDEIKSALKKFDYEYMPSALEEIDLFGQKKEDK